MGKKEKIFMSPKAILFVKDSLTLDSSKNFKKIFKQV